MCTTNLKTVINGYLLHSHSHPIHVKSKKEVKICLFIHARLSQFCCQCGQPIPLASSLQSEIKTSQKKQEEITGHNMIQLRLRVFLIAPPTNGIRTQIISQLQDCSHLIMCLGFTNVRAREDAGMVLSFPRWIRFLICCLACKLIRETGRRQNGRFREIKGQDSSKPVARQLNLP